MYMFVWQDKEMQEQVDKKLSEMLQSKYILLLATDLTDLST